MKRNKVHNKNQLEFFPSTSYTTDPKSIKGSISKQSEAKINPDQRRINHMPKFKPYHEFQPPLVGLCEESFLDYINTVIPKEHLCRLVKEVVSTLDTASIECKYSHLGQNSYHPKLMLNLLFYGYATGTRGSRKLEEKCQSDHNYIFLMQCYTPDHRTISDFRKNNLEELEKYFVEMVRIFNTLGFTQVGKIYIDGTKVKGNASAKRTKDKKGFEKWLQTIERMFRAQKCRNRLVIQEIGTKTGFF